MNTLSFQNGDQLPVIGLGTWNIEPREVFNAVLSAIQAGYRHIDCAPRYGNEPEVGEVLRYAFKQKLIKREEIWVTTKLWNNAHAEKDVEPALKASLNNLQLDYLDLYLIHWPVVFKPHIEFPETGEDFLPLPSVPIAETWEAMQNCVKKGLTRHIGVSNFSKKKINSLLGQSSHKPEMNQVELHPFLQQKALLEFCKQEGINVTAYAPLGSGGRADWLKKDDEPSLLNHPVIQKIADKHQCSPAQVLISWSVSRGTAVIPKSSNPGRIRENLQSIDISLTEEDRQAIAGMNRHFRYITGRIWTIPGSPFTLENLWDED